MIQTPGRAEQETALQLNEARSSQSAGDVLQKCHVSLRAELQTWWIRQLKHHLLSHPRQPSLVGGASRKFQGGQIIKGPIPGAVFFVLGGGSHPAGCPQKFTQEVNNFCAVACHAVFAAWLSSYLSPSVIVLTRVIFARSRSCCLSS